MTALNKQALRERYSEKPAPKCHICGSVMTIQRAGGGSVVYGCTGRIDKDGEGYKFAEGRDFADDHYARSRVTDYGPGGDPEVLALLDELEAAEKRIAELLSENAGLNNSVENAAGCINAAYAEGLIDVLSESNDERLVYLVKRRLLFAYLPVETPATNEELIAMGDWVLREQLEDGTRAIKTLNRRIAELEARDETKFVKCCSCKHDIEVLAIVDCDGYCPRCASPIDLDDEPYAGIGVKGE
ncbi:hypothetical protein B9P82_24250 [Citrobacter sp. L55]|nr:hypothetical protein B9P82_24250 [Citrobacter sp. L55]